MDWSSLADWWTGEIAGDPAYEWLVTPMLVEVLTPQRSHTYLDLGCGEGRVMKVVRQSGARVVGLDSTLELARHADGDVFVAELPTVPCRPGSVDGVYLVLTLEHLVDHRSVFLEAASATRAGGVLALVANHPGWTAPHSTPIIDADGEMLWRPGSYFSSGRTDIDVEGGVVTFHHRSMAELLNAAADAGWYLEKLIERPQPGLTGQIPRLLACRWRRGMAA